LDDVHLSEIVNDAVGIILICKGGDIDERNNETLKGQGNL